MLIKRTNITGAKTQSLLTQIQYEGTYHDSEIVSNEMEPERGYLSNHTMEQLRQTVPMAGQGELVSICWGEAAGEPQPKGRSPVPRKRPRMTTR